MTRSAPMAEAETGPAPRVRLLLVSRVVEQAVLGLATLLLARRLGVDAFAPVSVLLVVNSIAVTGSDFGLGAAVLRHPADRTLQIRVVHRLRRFNAAVVAVGLLAAVFTSGTLRTILIASVVIWALSAEAYVRKSVAIKIGRVSRVAAAEIVSSAAFAVAVVAAAVFDGQALVLVASGFCVKHLIEIAVVPHRGELFDVNGDPAGLGPVWGTQMLAFGISNVDYLIVGAAFTAPVFSVYVLGFRLANALPAQVASVATRVSMVDLAVLDREVRQAVYSRFMRQLFLVGLAGAVVTAALAPLLPWVLGPSWRAVVWVVLVLALAVPWRLVLGIAGSLALTGGITVRLLRWEVARLAFFAATLFLVSRIGFNLVVGVVTLAEVLAVVLYHEMAARATGLRPPRYLIPAAVATVVLTASFVWFVAVPAIP